MQTWTHKVRSSTRFSVSFVRRRTSQRTSQEAVTRPRPVTSAGRQEDFLGRVPHTRASTSSSKNLSGPLTLVSKHETTGHPFFFLGKGLQQSRFFQKAPLSRRKKPPWRPAGTPQCSDRLRLTHNPFVSPRSERKARGREREKNTPMTLTAKRKVAHRMDRRRMRAPTIGRYSVHCFFFLLVFFVSHRYPMGFIRSYLLHHRSWQPSTLRKDAIAF